MYWNYFEILFASLKFWQDPLWHHMHQWWTPNMKWIFEQKNIWRDWHIADLMKNEKNILQMLQMFSPCLGENQNIIQIDDNKMIKIIMKDFIHHPHKGGRSISEPKRHYKPLKETKAYFEHNFSSILRLHLNMMIPTFEIQHWKELWTLQLINQIINLWNWISIFDSDFI